jgi:tetratricopeptide (TPR) repeat protein
VVSAVVDFKLSEDADHSAYATCYAHGDYAGAIAHLERVLGRARNGGHQLMAAFLLTSIGRVYFAAEQREKAEAIFTEADREAEQSPQIRFFIASFYEEFGEDRDAAARWAQAIVDWESSANYKPKARSAEDLKYDRYYFRKAEELLVKLTGAERDG